MKHLEIDYFFEYFPEFNYLFCKGDAIAPVKSLKYNELHYAQISY